MSHFVADSRVTIPVPSPRRCTLEIVHRWRDCKHFFHRSFVHWRFSDAGSDIRGSLVSALNEQAAIRAVANELEVGLSVGCTESAGQLYMRQKRLDQGIRPNPEAPAGLILPDSNRSRGRTRGRGPLPDAVPPRPFEGRIEWGLAVLAIVVTAIMIGWGWGGRNGGWGQSNQIAQMTVPAAGLEGPATRAWTPPSNGHLR